MKEKLLTKDKFLNVLVKYFSIYFFTQSTKEKLEEKIQIRNDLKFDSISDIEQHCVKEQKKAFKTNEILIDIHIAKFKEGMVVFIKADHIIADGIGIIGLL